jgi:hypothetical protein
MSHDHAYLINCRLNVASVSGGHGLQSNWVLAADLHRAHLQLQRSTTMNHTV